MRSRLLLSIVLLTAVLLAGVPPRPAAAGSVEKSFAFELDKWYALDATDGPVTLHRIRLHRETGVLTKSAIFRPGNSQYLSTVQIQVEYTNQATKDWTAKLDITWVDGDDKTIDGYTGSENLDDGARHENLTVTLSTLRYGVDQAKKLKVHLSFDPE